jgi:hypothetical protein
MKHQVRSWPLLVLVAAAALILGSLGTATAAGLTVTQVKRIAAKVVDNKAPHLSVATARLGKNANRLGGQLPAAYLDRAVSSFDTSGVSGGSGMPANPNTGTELRPPVTLDIPSGVHAVVVSAGGSFISGIANDTSLWYAVDAPCTDLSGFGFDHRVVLISSPNTSMGTLNVLQRLTGSHTFRLCGNAAAVTGVFNAYITVETVAN